MLSKIILSLYISIAVLFLLSIFILFPFVRELLWAVIIVSSTKSIFIKIQKWCHHRRSLAVAIMTLLIVLVLLVPLIVGLFVFAKNSHTISISLHALLAVDNIDVPNLISDLPVLSDLWKHFVSGGVPGLVSRIESFISSNTQTVLAQFEDLSNILSSVILTIILAATFYALEDRLMSIVNAIVLRNLGAEGSRCFKRIGHAIRAVAFGVVGSALVTALTAALGLFIANIPYTFALSTAVFISALLMLGPVVILIPVIIWMLVQGSFGWAMFMIFWTILTVVFDEWVTATMIRGGTQMPGVMIFFGVLGGLTCFGVIGVFVGPVILETTFAVACILIEKNLKLTKELN
jgi:predicted PurR-regulated permease PerM